MSCLDIHITTVVNNNRFSICACNAIDASAVLESHERRNMNVFISYGNTGLLVDADCETSTFKPCVCLCNAPMNISVCFICTPNIADRGYEYLIASDGYVLEIDGLYMKVIKE